MWLAEVAAVVVVVVVVVALGVFVTESVLLLNGLNGVAGMSASNSLLGGHDTASCSVPSVRMIFTGNLGDCASAVLPAIPDAGSCGAIRRFCAGRFSDFPVSDLPCIREGAVCGVFNSTRLSKLRNSGESTLRVGLGVVSTLLARWWRLDGETETVRAPDFRWEPGRGRPGSEPGVL